ncbi:MAG: hypothetical protein JWR15_1657 [Prosthecobacter sp.]|nr:hypothetical protein [Prosthecobacter sp.]
MRKTTLLFYFLAASSFGAPLHLLETKLKPGTVTGPVWQGDMSQIYAAYERRDVKVLWNVFHQALISGLEPPKDSLPAESLSREVIKQVNASVRDYAGRLLSQIPGHAKFLGDEVDAKAADADQATQNSRNYYLNLLAELGSDESLHEIGRFWDDERGRLPPESEARAKAQQLENLSHGADVGSGGVYAVSIEARHKMWEALVYYPWMKNGEKGKLPSANEEERKKIEEWWQSGESTKYRQPIDLKRQPPPEQPPVRYDIKARRPETVRQEQPDAKLTLLAPVAVTNAQQEWPLYLTMWAALAALIWLYIRKKSSAP